MRRMLGRIALALLLVTVVDWAPGIPPDPLVGVAQVRAQQFMPVPASGLIMSSGASVTAVNSASEVSMYQYTVPAALIASATSVGAVGTPIYTGASASGLSTVPLTTVPAPLHFQAEGALAGAAGTTVNLGINFGTITSGTQAAGTQGLATVVLNNNIAVANTFPTPVYVDVWIQPIATTSATPNAINTVFMVARMQFLNASGTLTTTNQATIAAINLASPTQLNVVARWAAASSNSTLTLFSRILAIGR